jgi:hypothetical protein
LLLPEWNKYFEGLCREVKRSALERPLKCLWSAGSREAGRGIGVVFFWFIFFGDPKKMNPAGGPEPAGLVFRLEKYQ